MNTQAKVVWPDLSGRTITAADIPVGIFFHGVIGSYSNRLFRRVYEAIVELDGPEAKVWDLVVTVKDYRPVEVEITVK